MKRYMFLFCTLAILTVIGCGDVEKMYDSANYESLTNERGTIQLYSGGVLVTTYKNAKVLYSSSDTFALWLITDDNEKVYWQGEALIKLR